MKASVTLLLGSLMLSFTNCNLAQTAGRKTARRAFETSARFAALEWLYLIDQGDYLEAYRRLTSAPDGDYESI